MGGVGECAGRQLGRQLLSGRARSGPFAGLEDARTTGRDPLSGPSGEWDRSVHEWDAPAPSGGLGGLAGTREADPDEDAVTATASIDVLDWSSEVPEPAVTEVPAVVDGPRTEVSGTPLVEPLPPTKAVSRPSAPPPSKALLASALEIPVNWDDESHPFAGPGQADMRVGLERTAIIPATELGNLTFEPPPLDDPSPRSAVLAGSDDIPTSMALAEARADVRGDDALEADESIEYEADIEHEAAVDALETVDAVDEAPAGPVSDLSDIPVIETSRLMSLIDGADSLPHDTGADERPFSVEVPSLLDADEPPPAGVADEAVPPAVGASALSPRGAPDRIPSTRDLPTETMLTGPAAAFATTGPRGMVMSALDGERLSPKPGGTRPSPTKAVPHPSATPPSSEATRHATALVAALRSGASLSSPQRAELLLALGRLLLDKGMISEAELLKALLQ